MRTQIETDKQSRELSKIVTFNGQGCSGKSTQSEELAESNREKYKRFHSYKLRSDFKNKVYEGLVGRGDTCIKYSDSPDQTLYQVEILGIPTLAWLMAYFHLKIKPLQENYIVVLDHYIGDFYAGMLEGFCPAKFQDFVRITWVYLILSKASTFILTSIIRPMSVGGKIEKQRTRVKIG